MDLLDRPSSVVVLSLLVVWLIRRLIVRQNGGRLPPGPRPLPFIGNLLDMPSDYHWRTFTEWGRRWGDLTYINALGNQIVVVNSYKVAVDLLDKRSSIYSDRPPLISTNLIGYDKTLPFVSYGERFRNIRRLLSQTLGTRTQVDKFAPLQEQETSALLLRILQDPDDFLQHLTHFTGHVLLLFTFGYRVKDAHDTVFKHVFLAIDAFAEVTKPGAFLVDILPALRFVPSWLPGAGWKRRLSKLSKDLHELTAALTSHAKQETGSEIAIPNFVADNIERNPEMEELVIWSGVALVGGGVDTTLSMLYAFFLAMTLYPEVQSKAQAEIDAVIGGERLPTFQDSGNLPYVNTICLELLRWIPIAPSGAPHRLVKDDEYNGYFLPKGSIVFANIWGLLHDPEIYKNPEEFVPERFLSDEGRTPEQDPHSIAFGFGRRICPGIRLADASVFIVVANVLATFNISKRMENEIPITPVVGQSSATISHPLPFKCAIKPRSAAAEALVRAANLA